MRTFDQTDATVRAVEALMLDKFKSEPFHNLHLLYGMRPGSDLAGGTCSDKTLSFLAAAERAGFDVALHSGFIGGREIHRLARVHIGGRVHFADVGNGWPSLKLYPADNQTSFRCFGMGYRTEIDGHWLRVFHEKNGRESLQLEIDVRGRPESEIRADIARRFTSGVSYPFSSSLRYSAVVGDRFLFLRGERLEVYGDSGLEVIDGIDETQIVAVIARHFGRDVRSSVPRALWPNVPRERA